MVSTNPVPGACIVYVAATAHLRERARIRLEAAGYAVTEVQAEVDEALQAKAGAPNDALVDCLRAADLCVFLLPAEQSGDQGLGGAGAQADGLAKRIVCIVDGDREEIPQVFDDGAASLLRHDSVRLDDVINGAEVWEKPGGAIAPDRRINHVKCQ